MTETVLEVTVETTKGPLKCKFVHRTSPYQNWILRMDSDVDDTTATISIDNVWIELLKRKNLIEALPSKEKDEESPEKEPEQG